MRNGLKTRERSVKEVRAQLDEVSQALKRYHDAFESGKLDIEDVADRFKELKKQHKLLTAEYEDRTELRIYTEEEITPEVIAKLKGMFREELLNGSPGAIKQYLSILVESITVTDAGYEAICHTAGLLAAVEQKENLRTADVAEVRRSSIKWRPNCDANANYTLRFTFEAKPLKIGELRFARSQVLVWMDELVSHGKVKKWLNLPGHLDIGENLLVEYLEAA